MHLHRLLVALILSTSVLSVLNLQAQSPSRPDLQSASTHEGMGYTTPGISHNVSVGITYTRSTATQSLAASSSTPIASSYFGMHIHNLANPTIPSAKLTPFPAFRISTMRLWDTVFWDNIESKRNVYDWKRMDETVVKARANGVSDFIFTFGYVPQWASSNPHAACGSASPGSCFPPDNYAYLDSFADKLVQRYCGVVKYYETWNEPSATGFWMGTNAEFLAMTQHIYRAVKDPANCGCKDGKCSPRDGPSPNIVLLPPINATTSPSARQWLENWLSYVGNPYPYADIAAFHGYGYTSNPEEIQIGVNYMKNTLSQYGLGSAELWDTEASWGNTSPATEDEQASWLIRFQIMQSLSGVSRFTWYAYDNCDWGTLWGSPLCKGQSISPGVHDAATAYSTVQNWLSGATLQGCNGYADGTWLCKLTRPGGYAAWAAWNSNGSSTTLDASSMQGLIQYRNWQNEKNTITGSVQVGSMPILIESADAF